MEVFLTHTNFTYLHNSFYNIFGHVIVCYLSMICCRSTFYLVFLSLYEEQFIKYS
jgi:hypothetical protein